MKKMPAIIGIGRTKFGEHYEQGPENLIIEAGIRAQASAGLERKDIESYYISDYFLQVTNKIGLEEGFMSQLLDSHIPMERMRSFSSAFSNACYAIEAGLYDLVLVGGIEKMTDRWGKIRDNLMLLEDPWSYYAGGTPESNHEIMLREYLKTNRISGKNIEKFMLSLAQISVMNHSNAMNNDYAHFQREIKVEQVIRARLNKNTSLGLYDFAPISDGATALLLANSKISRNYTDTPVYVYSTALATDYINYPSRLWRDRFIATQIAMKKALKKAKISVDKINLIEVYDQSTLLQMISLEDMGFAKEGKCWRDINQSFEKTKKSYMLEGREIFVNTNGGLKADGNPLGATGGAQIYEVVTQLKGEAKERQIMDGKNLSFGCIQEIEGFGTKVYIHILGR